MSVVKQLIRVVRSAGLFNPEIQVAPACILWPDGDRQWEAIIPRLQKDLPELFVLGDYAPENRTGPGIWLRCVVAGKVEEYKDFLDPEVKKLPVIIYLPGVSRQDLRAVESCPEHLKPIAELQYSGVIWSQINAKDWTILAFLKSDQGGLGLDVGQDNDTKRAMQLALFRLLEEEIDLLKGKRLDKDYFNTLLTGGDPVRDLLQWLDLGDAFKRGRDENSWTGFVEVCKSQLAFDPENDGILKGAELLAEHKGPWLSVWERFCEAPKRYPNIPDQIRKCKAPSDTFFWLMDEGSYDGWPQWNQEQEDALRSDLLALANLPAHEARKHLLDIGKRHDRRRSLVWTELGEAPLACAVAYLVKLSDVTVTPLTAGTARELADAYGASGWQADDAVLRALECVSRQKDFDAVKTAIQSVYLPWAEDAARYLQKVSRAKGYPGSNHPKAGKISLKESDCILFVDGLRFDAARRLSEMLSQKGLRVEESAGWAAIPTVTATGKPAVTPVAHLIEGQDVNADFEPCVASTGQSLKGGYHLQKLLTDAGWNLQDKPGGHKPQGPAWFEAGDIDHEGHNRGWKLAQHLNRMLEEILDRIENLLASGFMTIHVVTDHGWLLMPGGLPKVELPFSLTENTWGRCAALKPGAFTDESLYPWFWNPNQEFALADGISCYRAGMEYAHGGLSLQECLTLRLKVSADNEANDTTAVQVADVAWKGLRCKVAVEGEAAGLFLDLRTQPGNASSSVAMGSKPFKEDGTSSVVVENEDMEGREATLVVVDSGGLLIAQRPVVIGKEQG